MKLPSISIETFYLLLAEIEVFLLTAILVLLAFFISWFTENKKKMQLIETEIKEIREEIRGFKATKDFINYLKSRYNYYL